MSETGEEVTLKAEKERWEDPTLLVLKMANEVQSQGTDVVPGSYKMQGNRLSPEMSEKNTTPPIPSF